MATRLSTLCALVVCLLAGRVGAVQLPGEDEKWFSVRTVGFVVYSNVSQAETARLAGDLVRMSGSIGALTGLGVRTGPPTTIFVFADRSMFEPFCANIPDVESSGFFLAGGDGNYIALHAEPPANRVLYHELTHELLRHDGAAIPAWINEGLAEYFSTFAVKNGAADVGIAPSEDVAQMRRGKMIPLAYLLAVDDGAMEQAKVAHSSLFYAESWSLVHSMLSGERPFGELTEYLSLRRDHSIDESVRLAFHTTVDEMEKKLREYVRKSTFPSRRYELQVSPPSIPQPRLVSHDEILFQLGHLLTWRGIENFADAEELLREAIRVNPAHARAWTDLARIDARHGRVVEAAGEYETAVQLGSADAAAYCEYATLLGSSGPRARALFRQATGIDPGSQRAWAGLAATYDDDPMAGVAAFEEDLPYALADPVIARDLVQLYARAGCRDEAVRITGTIRHPEVLRQACEVILSNDVKRAHDLLQDGQSDQAAALFRSVLEETTNEPLAQALTSQIAPPVDGVRHDR